MIFKNSQKFTSKPSFCSKNIAGNEELNKKYNHLLNYPPQHFNELINKDKGFKQDLANSYFPYLSKKHKYHQPKMLSHYQKMIK